MKRILKLAVYGIAAIAAFSSCSKNEDVPSQKDIETKIIGRWKTETLNGQLCITNGKEVTTYNGKGQVLHSASIYVENIKTYIWHNQVPMHYAVSGNMLSLTSDEDKFEFRLNVKSIDEKSASFSTDGVYVNGKEEKISQKVFVNKKVTADYSQDIIGMWEGVEMTGDETYGDANHRIYYKEDGTYIYYDKVGDSWVPSKNAGNEYNVDGDWLATRWQPTEGADYEYEWWDIDEIKDGTMKWSALREKGDGTRYTTTFTWKKIQLQ